MSAEHSSGATASTTTSQPLPADFAFHRTSASAELRSNFLEIQGQRVLRLWVKSATSYSSVEIFLRGAHVTSWEEAGQKPFLFVSKNAILDGSKPIRGGIPVIFPQFSNFGPLPAHGFARNVLWSVRGVEAGQGSDVDSLTATFVLSSDDATLKTWPHKFRCEYSVTLAGATNSRLTCAWKIINEDSASAATDATASPFRFGCALHTYFSIGDISKCVVSGVSEQKDAQKTGMQGVTYVDQLQARKRVVETNQDIAFNSEVDRVYLQAPDHMVVIDEAFRRRIHVEKLGFPDAVVWNPWIAKSKTMADFEPTEYTRMVCVESASLGLDQPNDLAPGQSWLASIQLSVEKMP